MRRIVLLIASAAAVVISSVSPLAESGSSQQPAGQESQYVADAVDWFTLQRLAPNGAVDPNAFSAAADQAASLQDTSGLWTERTNLPGAAGNDFSDSPKYIDPTSGFSNSGAGDRWVAGRMTALAASPDGATLFAGAAGGGVWKSTDGGNSWTPIFDAQGTLSVGALLVVPSKHGYTLYAGTGEANTSSDSYAGIGVLASQNGSSTWTKVGGSILNGALIFRLVNYGNKLFAASSHGLYEFTVGTSTDWTAVLQPAGPPVDGKNFNLVVGNMITDVAIRPGTNGQQVLGVAGWRGGAPTNGFYVSNDGGSTFTFLANPHGWVPAKDEGRTTIAYSSAGDRAYAIVQSPYLLNVGTNGHTLLQGVFESANGDPNGPWTKIADSSKLASSGSAQFIPRIGTGYQPGIQAWYNQFLAVDPSNRDHLYLGLEEVYETQVAGSNWETVAPYWNFGFKCFSYTPFEGTCNHRQAHSDQHAAMIVGNTFYIGNDGGVYSRSLSDHVAGDWADLNMHLDALQYYSAAASSDSLIYGGLQDNGSNLVFSSPMSVPDDTGTPTLVSSVQVFGGDGGYTLVDPANSQNVITEYVDLIALQSTDGGQNWHFINPPDPDPRFISPIAMDRTTPSHLVAGGALVWNSEAGVAGTNTPGAWQSIFDVRTALGANPAAQVSALDAVNVGGVEYVAAAWCGPCNVRFSTGTGFHSGIVVLQNSNDGTGWHVASQACTGTSTTCTAGLPKRYISGVRIDNSDPTHAYLSLSGYSRKWMIGPDDPGVGHVFETHDGGNTWTNRSGNLPDVPADDIVLQDNGTLDVATDIGVFTSSDNGSIWSVLGSNLPHVVVDQLTLDPSGQNLVAATHGRGIWMIQAP
jgi:photosystem II stability/assembly factor-like uncharacterized protein